LSVSVKALCYGFGVTKLQAAVVAWFRAGHRAMPWREARDPYAIWVSEIMLQQTQVKAVIPYWERWMARFPTVTALAEAPLDDVLQHWSGLGYYARARNLHLAAKDVQATYGGSLPRTAAELRQLRGIGPYTAGAVASIAFGEAAPILDGNVARVLSRVFVVDGPPDAAATKKRLWDLAAELVPTEAASDFNQGLMELGATVCVPENPRCLLCPLRGFCGGLEAGRVAELPAKKRKKPPRELDAVAVLVERGQTVFHLRRPPDGLWGGLWEPPWVELDPGEDPADAAIRILSGNGLTATDIQWVGEHTHQLTHRTIRFSVFKATAEGQPVGDDIRWLEPTAKVGVAAWTRTLIETFVSGKRARS